MNGYITPGLYAIGGASLLAVILFIPFVARSYRVHGRLGFWRTIGSIALLVYTLALITYTTLPLPTDPTLIRCAAPQLAPFQFIDDIRTVQAQRGGTPLANPAVLQVVFNVLLFAPLGVLLRALFARGVIVATALGFVISLAIELTQLTGIWGIYPCAYRLFDVDDLMLNTLGALVGSLIALPVFVFAGERGDERRVRPVTGGRRLLGMFCDVFLVTVIGAVVTVGYRVVFSAMGGSLDAIPESVTLLTSTWIPLGIQLLAVLATGSTLGEGIVALRAVAGPLPGIIARPIRFAAGIGAYGVLSVAEFPGAQLILFVLVVVSAVMALVGDKRGLAATIAGTRVVDVAERPAVSAPAAR